MNERSLLTAMKWSLLADWAARAIPPVIFIVLARLLTPADFGVMSAALVVIALSQIVWEAGMSKALVRWQGEVDEAANAMFWINVGLGLIVAGALFAVSDSVARTFFHDTRVTAVLRVMTLGVFLGAFGAVHTALLQREMKFQQLFWVRFATVLLPGLASIPLARAGMGHWALVAGTLAGQAAQVIMLWRSSHWRPKWSFDRAIAGRLLRFGRWVGLTGLVAWVYAWADSFIAGHYFGTTTMGLYRVGNQAAIMPFEFLFAFAGPVLYSRFSAHANDFDRVRGDVLRVNGIVGALSLPLALSLIVFSPLIESTVFGPKWQTVGWVIAMIAAKEGVLWVFAYNIEAYRALDRPHLETTIAVLSAALNPLILILCAREGFGTFLIGRAVILGLIGVAIHASFSFYVFGRAAVGRTYAALLLIFVVCASLFGIRRVLGDFFDLRAAGYIADAAVALAAFAFAFALQKDSIAELARAVMLRNRARAESV